MDNGIPALDLDATDAYTEVFLQGQSLVHISLKWAYRGNWHEMRIKNQT